MSNYIKEVIKVKEKDVNIIRIGNNEYISLTDIARFADKEEPRLPIRDWMRNKSTIKYLGLWEGIYNKNFKGGVFDTFKNEAGDNLFKMSPQKWIRETNAIGIISKSGRYDGGTFAHPDIAFEFAGWISPEIKLYIIQEFQRLKKEESYQKKIEWHSNRLLSKANYLIHTKAVSDYIVPTLTDKQKRSIYAEEADVLNVALFGMTAKEWRERNPELSKEGNIRDFTDILHLIILNNLETINAELIKMNIDQRDRLIRLNETARTQMETLKNNKNLDLIYKISNNIE